MDTTYWSLFWSTGMPEAWLMSRNGEGARQAGFGTEPDGWQRLSNSPLASYGPQVLGGAPGNPGRLY